MGLCAKECLGDRDCPSGETCSGNRCKRADAGGNVSNLPDAGNVNNTAPDGGADASGCSYNSDCPPSLVCRAQDLCGRVQGQRRLSRGALLCRIAVRGFRSRRRAGRLRRGLQPPVNTQSGSSAARPGNVFSVQRRFRLHPDTRLCVLLLPSTHACVTGAVCRAEAGVVSQPTDGAAPDAAKCDSDLGCDDDGVLCNGAERCVSGYCRPALRPACDDNNPCTVDACNEASKACSHTQTALADIDGDGHYAIACGGDADDCDDSNPLVYPGHPELCDGVDNNCNGIVDEGVWRFGVPSSYYRPLTQVSATSTRRRSLPDPRSRAPPPLGILKNGTLLVAATTHPPTGPNLIGSVELTSTLESRRPARLLS